MTAAENQQTVEAARILDRALTSEGAMARYYRGRTDWGQFHEAIEKERAALRDLVAQADEGDRLADLAARVANLTVMSGSNAESITYAVTVPADENVMRELLTLACDIAARLDGAR